VYNGLAEAEADPGRPPAASSRGGKQQGGSKAAENKGGKLGKEKKGRRLLLGSVVAADGAHGSEHARKQPSLGDLQFETEQPAASSYSAAILSALREESSAAARLAVKQLKAVVMQHNAAVAAAFMAETEGQHSRQEQAEDAAQWRLRVADRQEQP
jgi:hypothetical protein